MTKRGAVVIFTTALGDYSMGGSGSELSGKGVDGLVEESCDCWANES